MILVSGSVPVDPDHREEAAELATEMVEATRQEPGCIEYRFSADLDDECTFYVFERWESQAALDAHFDTDHMARFQAEMPPLLDGDLDVTQYEVAAERDSS